MVTLTLGQLKAGDYTDAMELVTLREANARVTEMQEESTLQVMEIRELQRQLGLYREACVALCQLLVLVQTQDDDRE